MATKLSRLYLLTLLCAAITPLALSCDEAASDTDAAGNPPSDSGPRRVIDAAADSDAERGIDAAVAADSGPPATSCAELDCGLDALCVEPCSCQECLPQTSNGLCTPGWVKTTCDGDPGCVLPPPSVYCVPLAPEVPLECFAYDDGVCTSGGGDGSCSEIADGVMTCGCFCA